MSLDFTTDCHVHSERSYCAEGVTLEKYIVCARERGIRRFAITDHSFHLYFSEEVHADVNNDELPESFPRVMEARRHIIENYIEYLKKYRSYGVRVGMELEQMYSGEYIFDWRYKDEFDVLVGSVHRLPAKKRGLDVESIKKNFLEFTLRAMDFPIHVLAHPTRALRRAKIPVPPEYCDMIIKKALCRGIALEINSHSLDPDLEFVRRCIELGAIIALGTDSHKIEEFGDFSFHKQLLSQAGLNGTTAQHASFYTVL